MENLIKDIEIIPAETSCNLIETTKEAPAVFHKKLYIESYGCAMNFSDSEIVTSILHKEGYGTTSSFETADVIFLNTCSIRDKAEQTIRHRLAQFNTLKRQKPELVIGVLGCMAERLKEKLLEEEKIVDLVVGPDAYRSLPELLKEVEEGDKAINTFLSREETYADISPVRLNSNGISAFISIMRGCDNMCSFCVVPFTRGRERSRDPHSIVKEATDLFENGFREVTLLGQNVDSYKWSPDPQLKGKAKIDRYGGTDVVNFAHLLEMMAAIHPDLRIRFSTSHPKDITDDVLHAINKHENICNYIHLPAQSGNNRILQLMNRTYTREWYLDRVKAIRTIIGDECGISSDMIAGFCSETEEEHQDSLSLIEEVGYDFSYMFFYSERPGTLAEKKFKDDVPLEIKKRRLSEIIAKQKEASHRRNLQNLNKIYRILIDGDSKKSPDFLQGKTSANKIVVFPKGNYKKGEYVNVLVKDCTSATLLGEVV